MKKVTLLNGSESKSIVGKILKEAIVPVAKTKKLKDAVLVVDYDGLVEEWLVRASSKDEAVNLIYDQSDLVAESNQEDLKDPKFRIYIASKYPDYEKFTKKYPEFFSGKVNFVLTDSM